MHSLWKLSLNLSRSMLKHYLHITIIFRIEIKTHISLCMKSHNIPSPEHINITRIRLGIISLSQQSWNIKMRNIKFPVWRSNMWFIVREQRGIMSIYLLNILSKLRSQHLITIFSIGQIQKILNLLRKLRISFRI